MLRIRRWDEMGEAEKAELRARSAAEPDAALRASIVALIDDVAERGDRAVCDALASHDGVRIEPSQLLVGAAEIDRAVASVSPEVRSAIEVMVGNIRAFNQELLARRSSWQTELAPGHVVGERVTPVASAAAYCPSGKASYPSVLAQVATGAVVAGVPELVVLIPPVPGGSGEIDPAALTVARELGIDQVYRVNGPAGVAAAAVGTETIPRVTTIVGPGGPPVALAQLEVRRFGVDSVMLGPSESLIVADASSEVDLVAADLINEAEHGQDGTVLLVTPESDLAEAVSAACAAQSATLPDERRAAVEASIGVNGGAVIVEDMDRAVEVANWFAPEHLQIATADPWPVAERIVHAGEVLVGQDTPLSAANFCIGVPASLPTGGFARQSGGITVETFLKSTSVASLSPEALDRIGASTVALADHEGFPAHANAIHIRSS